MEFVGSDMLAENEMWDVLAHDSVGCGWHGTVIVNFTGTPSVLSFVQSLFNMKMIVISCIVNCLFTKVDVSMCSTHKTRPNLENCAQKSYINMSPISNISPALCAIYTQSKKPR